MKSPTQSLLKFVKTLIMTILFLLFISDFALAQSGWFLLNSGSSESLLSVFFTDANSGFISGWNGTLIKTTNGGSNWFPLSIVTTNALRSVFFTDVNTGYVVSGNPTVYSDGDIYKTTNGGTNWNSLNLPIHKHFYSIHFINSSTGFVSGFQVILKTTNAGSTWESQTIPGNVEWLHTIYFGDGNTGYAAGGTDYLSDRYIIRTTNGGSNWQTVYSYSGSGTFFGICFINASTGVAVGGPYYSPGTYVYRTSNAGINWTEVFTDNNSAQLWSARFVNSSIGYIAGGSPGINGVILKTTNSGFNWYFQTPNANDHLTGNYFIDVNTGYVVGRTGRILKTTDGGGPLVSVISAGNELPVQFHLYQNYPNPFNPATKIRFSLPNSFKGGKQSVLLIICDILGKEISTLINKQLSPGTYEVEWNAADYSSGVYYYKLVADDYTETKKMVLVK
jgi:photosystem II stability/assembly factor-like uncharacterized protein